MLSVKDELDHLIQTFGNQRDSKNAIIGVPTGFSDLDDMTAGFQKSEFIVIAGRPSHGKTALSMNIARNAAVDHGKSVAIFSLEMSFRELLLRLLSGEARVDGKKLKTGNPVPKNGTGFFILIINLKPISLLMIQANFQFSR